MLTSTVNWLQERGHLSKVMIVAAADLVLLTLTLFVAYMLRVSNFSLPALGKLPLYLVAPALSVMCAAGFGVYQTAARGYTSTIERKLFLSQLLVPLIWAVILLLTGAIGFARSVVFIYGALAIIVMVVLRRLASYLFLRSGQVLLPQRQRVPVLIYGAGREGMMVADSLRRQGKYRPVAFVDTDYTIVDRKLGDLRVFAIDNLRDVVQRFAPVEAIIAKSHSNRAQRRALVDMLISHGLDVKTVPAVSEVLDGRINVSDIRPVKVEDLLGRDPVPPEKTLMDKAVKNQVVMVTGAGGSIGSELVRQAAAFGPRKLVLVDNSEFSLFEIHREIEAAQLDFALVPLLADVKDMGAMSAIMREHKVDIVLHAAAYKHVRMVQENAASGIANNVFGTRAVAEAAIANGVKRFVLVSTDKAVRPTSIMGASKRVAEMVVQALAAKPDHSTILSMVRFGNVLGSTGSVVPLFRQQIAAGGPVLVTDPMVTRYFMLIPEAAQLVIQAGAMAEGGEVFVLDMGEPVKIVDLARSMIELAGLSERGAGNPDGDIEIRFIGLRDGEKLYEELQIGNDTAETGHPRIMRSREFCLPLAKLEAHLSRIASGGEVTAIEVVTKLAAMPGEAAIAAVATG